jgi:hypothetical protein
VKSGLSTIRECSCLFCLHLHWPLMLSPPNWCHFSSINTSKMLEIFTSIESLPTSILNNCFLTEALAFDLWVRPFTLLCF